MVRILCRKTLCTNHYFNRNVTFRISIRSNLVTIQSGIDAVAHGIVNLGSIGAGLFGLLNRLLIPIGLHHVMNTYFWFVLGDFTNAAGDIVHGDIARFFAKDPSAGMFMTGFFPVMMFGLPAACFAMIAAAKPEKRKMVTGMLGGLALTSFLTGITEPIEFSFMFLSPVLYGIHAVLTGLSLFITTTLGIHDGFSFSAGAIDYVLNFGIATKPLLLAGIGLIYAAIYFVVFYFLIKKFDLKLLVVKMKRKWLKAKKLQLQVQLVKLT